jgi:hypothetical protein
MFREINLYFWTLESYHKKLDCRSKDTVLCWLEGRCMLVAKLLELNSCQACDILDTRGHGGWNPPGFTVNVDPCRGHLTG